jgi:hypothetical protein
MILRILILFLIPAVLLAGDYFVGLTPGQSEVMHFQLVTFQPGYSKADNELIIKLTDETRPLLILTQTIDMKDQKTRIVTVEKYVAKTFELLTSKTILLFPPEVAGQLGAESLEITARPENGKLMISSDFPTIPPAEVEMGDDLYTGIGSMVLARRRHFELNNAYRYRQINLVNIAGEPFKPVDVVDSVVSVDEYVSTPLGDYECYKVLKILPDLAAYTYYSKKDMIPVLVEAFNRGDGQRSMNITIDGYYRK